ncbi:MAG: hypothetical protein NWF03_02465 [Candidatus Bathyarchaeota archaeon]|nr:hypothetical protein [Candidatus Bathyarchaeota archaeon]
MSKNPNNELILNVINRGLDTLGESPKQAIWIFLEKEYNVSSTKLPLNVREFQEGLQKIFGVGYNFLDNLFCQFLKDATGKQFKNCKSFVECVEALQQQVPVVSCQKG